MNRYVLLMLALAIPGCGGGGDGTPPPPAPEPVKLVSSTLDDNAENLPISTRIEFRFDGPLADELPTVSVKREFPNGTSVEWPVTASFADDHETLIITPDQAYALGAAYRIELTDLQGSSGLDVTSVSSTFLTQKKRRLALIEYSYDESGALISEAVTQHVTEVEKDGGLRKVNVMYADHGTDQQPFTGDEEPTSYIEFLPSEDLSVDRRLGFDGPGDDEIWFTVDDNLYGLGEIEAVIDERHKRTVSYFPDDEPFSENDVPSGYTDHFYDEHGNLIEEVQYTDAGDDGEFFSGDDKSNRHDKFEYDSHVLLSREIRLGPGPNGLLGDEDDVPASIDVYTRDERGRTESVSVYASDVNGELAIDDTHRASVVLYKYDDIGKLLRTVHYSDAGQNGVWFDADDTGASRVEYVYIGVDDLLERTRSINRGPDELLGTNDDLLIKEDFSVVPE